MHFQLLVGIGWNCGNPLSSHKAKLPRGLAHVTQWHLATISEQQCWCYEYFPRLFLVRSELIKTSFPFGSLSASHEHDAYPGSSLCSCLYSLFCLSLNLPALCWWQLWFLCHVIFYVPILLISLTFCRFQGKPDHKHRVHINRQRKGRSCVLLLLVTAPNILKNQKWQVRTGGVIGPCLRENGSHFAHSGIFYLLRPPEHHLVVGLHHLLDLKQNLWLSTPA